MSNKPLRRLGFGLATLFGIARRGFFVPYRYADQVPDWRDIPPYPAFETRFAAAAPVLVDLLDGLSAHAGAFAEFGRDPPPQPRWNQDWFPRLDGAAAYALVRRHRPRRIVEVGSGHSTRFLARAVRDQGCPTEITAIDPAPRASLAGLPVTAIRAPLHRADPAVFDRLDAGDVLFIDSSHLAFPGTDVDSLFARILPRLPAGVLVHIHDIVLPDPYPAAWAWRAYNEQVATAALLVGGGFEILWASHYAATRLAAAVDRSAAAALALPRGARETSLWLRKTTAAWR